MCTNVTYRFLDGQIHLLIYFVISELNGTCIDSASIISSRVNKSNILYPQ